MPFAGYDEFSLPLRSLLTCLALCGLAVILKIEVAKIPMNTAEIRTNITL
jgi:hypothetical protein